MAFADMADLETLRRLERDEYPSLSCIMSRIRQFLSDSDAATAVEYAVMLALILMAVIGAVTVLGQNTAGSFNSTTSRLQNAGFGR